MSIIVVHGEEAAVVQFAGPNDALVELEFEEEVIVELSAYFLLVDVCECLVREGDFAICQVFGGVFGELVESSISKFVATVEAWWTNNISN